MATRRLCLRSLPLATLFVARAASAEDSWHGVYRDPPSAQVEIPAGALPPGPAELRDDGPPDAPARVTLRFEMPKGHPAELRIPVFLEDHRNLKQGQGGEARLPFIARSDSGATWRGSVPTSEMHAQTGREVVFLGTAARLEELTAAARRHALPSQLQYFESGVHVSSPKDTVARGCRFVAAKALVVAADVTPEQGEVLRGCASVGANVLFIGKDVAGEAGAFPPGEAVAWGLGAIAWAPVLDDLAVRGVLDFPSVSDLQRDQRTRLTWIDDAQPGPDADASWRVRRRVVLAFLLLYVAVLGPVGYVVDRRARRPWLAWAWLPAVAATGTGVLAVSLAATEEGRRAVGDVRVVSMTTPGGDGLETTTLRIQGTRPDAYGVTLPWRDADGRFAATFRYGSPFGAGSRGLELHGDDVRGEMTARGLGVSRYAQPTASATQPVRRVVPRLEQKDGQWSLVNATQEPIAYAEVVVGGLSAVVRGLAPGASQPVGALRAIPHTIDDAEHSRAHRQVEALTYALSGQRYAIVAETTSAAPGVTTAPPIPLVVDTLRVVLGQLPDTARLP
jgi:hypothetical protein